MWSNKLTNLWFIVIYCNYFIVIFHLFLFYFISFVFIFTDWLFYCNCSLIYFLFLVSFLLVITFDLKVQPASISFAICGLRRIIIVFSLFQTNKMEIKWKMECSISASTLDLRSLLYSTENPNPWSILMISLLQNACWMAKPTLNCFGISLVALTTSDFLFFVCLSVKVREIVLCTKLTACLWTSLDFSSTLMAVLGPWAIHLKKQ